jgi:hypothetical protein
MSIPKGETDVKVELQEFTIGYVCPIYFAMSKVTKKTNVFSFGRVSLDLLNLLDYLRNRAMNLNWIMDPAILVEEGGANVQ